MTTVSRGCSRAVDDMIVVTGVQTKASISRGYGIVLFGDRLSQMSHRPKEGWKEQGRGRREKCCELGTCMPSQSRRFLLHVTVLLPGILVEHI